MIIPVTPGCENASVLEVPAHLSPSSIKQFRDCPQKYKLSYIDKIKEPPKWHLHLGSFVHEVLEHLYALPAPDRTVDALKSIAKTRWEEHGWIERVESLDEKKGSLVDFKREAFEAMTNLWAIEDPTVTDLDAMERKVRVEVDGVTMSGVIDRLALEGDLAVISDYKTGKIPNSRFPNGSDEEKFFQLLAYALMLESLEGRSTSRVELLYLTQKTRHTLDVTPAHLAVARGTIVETREALDAAAATGDFHCNVTKLCDWCHYKTTGDCPVFPR